MPKLKAVLWSVIISIASYGVWIAFNEYDAVIASVKQLGLFGFATICGLSLLNYFIRFIRWHWYLNIMGYSIPLFRHILYYLSGFALTTTPGKAGEAIRSLYLKHHGVDYPTSLAAFVSERFSDLISVLLIALIAITYFKDYQYVAVGFGVFLVIAIAMIQSISFRHFCSEKIQKHTSGKLSTVLLNIIEIVEQMAQLMTFKVLIIGLILGVISWGCEAYAFAIVGQAMGSNTPALIFAGIYAISMLIGAVSFLPGGLGSTEAVMYLLLISIGMDSSVAVSATLLCRITTLWLAVFVGFIALFIVEIKFKSGGLLQLSKSTNAET
ncbi:MAG: flippase-like domain-containing protein [Pseudomonadales bacterium]|nr:flippase-like domain-containing protein [Pseudomonadales bacterium]